MNAEIEDTRKVYFSLFRHDEPVVEDDFLEKNENEYLQKKKKKIVRFGIFIFLLTQSKVLHDANLEPENNTRRCIRVE